VGLRDDVISTAKIGGIHDQLSQTGAWTPEFEIDNEQCPELPPTRCLDELIPTPISKAMQKALEAVNAAARDLDEEEHEWRRTAA
jgi:hypothetical protein